MGHAKKEATPLINDHIKYEHWLSYSFFFLKLGEKLEHFRNLRLTEAAG